MTPDAAISLQSTASAGWPVLSIIVLAPIVGAALILLVPATRLLWIRAIALLSATVSLGLSSMAAIWVAGPASFGADIGGLHFAEDLPIVEPLGIRWSLAADGWSLALLLLTGVIIYAGVLSSWTLEARAKEFFILLLVLVGGVFGVFVAQDLFLFFLFYEIAVLPMYLLIGIWGSSNEVAAAGPFAVVFRMLDVGGREYAAMKLTLMLLAGSALILAGMLGMYWEAGQSFALSELAATEFSPWLQWLAFPALWVGFGTLAGLWPFHTWSPDGHAAAPTAVSMLHAGVLMKLGAFGVIRIGMVLLPDGAADWAFVVGTVAVINVLYGALAAMRQEDLKYIIAYSSVSHMGIVLLGAATLTQNGWNGAVFQMVAHGVMTGLFFALVGWIYGCAHDRWIPGMGGFVQQMPFVTACFVLASLSSLGLPATAGFVAEFLVFLAAWEGAHPWWAIPAMLGAFVTAVYVLAGARSIFFGEGPPERFTDLADPEGPERVALWILAGCIVLLGVFPHLLLVLIDPATSTYLPLALR